MDHPKFMYWNSKVNGMELLGGPLEDRSQGLQPHRWNWCLTKWLNVINLLPFCTLLCESIRPPPDPKCWYPDHGIQDVRNNVVYGLPSLGYMAMLIYLPDVTQKSLGIPLNNRAEEFSRNRTSLDWFTSTLQPLKFSHLSQRHSLPSSSSSSRYRIALCKTSLLSPLFNSSQLQPAQLLKPQDLDFS